MDAASSLAVDPQSLVPPGVSAGPRIDAALAGVGALVVVADSLVPPGQSSGATVDGQDATRAALAVGVASVRALHLGPSYFARLDVESAPVVALSPTGSLEVIAGSTMTSIIGGQVVFLGLLEDIDELRVSLPLPAGTLSELHVAATVGPGAGQSFTYAVSRNGVAQNVAATLSGATTSGSSTGAALAFGAGDRFCVRLTTSAGAATATHRFAIKYQLAV